MRKAYVIAAAVVLASGVGWWGGVGRAQQEGVGEKVGEKLDQAGRKLKQGLNRAEGAVREGFHKTRDSVHSMGVQARVYGRLHWDKALTQSDLHVKVEEGIATLSGSVPTVEARTKAVTLAADTVGVTKVVDELVVPATEADPVPARKP
jgi:hyperosmotically inducible periplasmic protein